MKIGIFEMPYSVSKDVAAESHSFELTISDSYQSKKLDLRLVCDGEISDTVTLTLPE